MVSHTQCTCWWTTIVTIRYLPPQVVCGQEPKRMVGKNYFFDRECEMRTLVARLMALSQRLVGPVEALRRRRRIVIFTNTHPHPHLHTDTATAIPHRTFLQLVHLT
jgi:hypothetical protein